MIHSTSIVSKKAKISQDVDIGPFTVIYDNVEIESGTVIEGCSNDELVQEMKNKKPVIPL